MAESSIEVTFWGVRGSYPVISPSCNCVGGNTACTTIKYGDHYFAVDAGSGMFNFGRYLSNKNFSGHVDLLLSHTHWDHIQGFPFFVPLYSLDDTGQPVLSVTVYSLMGVLCNSAHPDKNVLLQQQDPRFSSRPFNTIKAPINFVNLTEGQKLKISGLNVQCLQLNHHEISCGYRFESEHSTVAYISDVSPWYGVLLAKHLSGLELSDTEKRSFMRKLYQNQLVLAKNADMVIYDTYFNQEGYSRLPHYGHSTFEDALEVCSAANAKNIFMFHHNPGFDDAFLCKLEAKNDVLAKHCGINVFIAREGDSWLVGSQGIQRIVKKKL